MMLVMEVAYALECVAVLDQGADEVIEPGVVQLALRRQRVPAAQRLLQQQTQAWGGAARVQAIGGDRGVWGGKGVGHAVQRAAGGRGLARADQRTCHWGGRVDEVT